MTEVTNQIDVLKDRFDEYLDMMTSKEFIDSIDFAQAEILIKFIETTQDLSSSYETTLIHLIRENQVLKKCRSLDQYAEQQNLERNLKEKTDGDILENDKFRNSCRSVFNDLKDLKGTNTNEDYKTLSKVIRDSLKSIERVKKHSDIIKRIKNHQKTLKNKV